MNNISLETLFDVASELTKKQDEIRSMIAGPADPKLLLELSRSLREVSQVNRKIAELVRAEGQARRQSMVLVNRDEKIAA